MQENKLNKKQRREMVGRGQRMREINKGMSYLEKILAWILWRDAEEPDGVERPKNVGTLLIAIQSKFVIGILNRGKGGHIDHRNKQQPPLKWRQW